MPVSIMFKKAFDQSFNLLFRNHQFNKQTFKQCFGAIRAIRHRADRPGRFFARLTFALLLNVFARSHAGAQGSLENLPAYARYQAQTQKLDAALRGVLNGRLEGNWKPDGSAFVYARDGKYYQYDVAQQKITAGDAPVERSARIRRPRPGRGRQFRAAISSDSQWKAFYKDGNVWISRADDTDPVQVSKDGDTQARIFNGTASWVYGEELEQNTALWWSPDGKKLAYYRFDESKVSDYFVTLSSLKVQDSVDVEPYPKAGAPNPVVDISIYDVQTRQNVRMDVRDGKPFTDDVVGHYVYNVRWSSDGSQLLFYRANRLQNVLEFVACDPHTGKCRTIVRETNAEGWTPDEPSHAPLTFLKDGRRFIWTSERAGWRNLYLYDLNGTLLQTLTRHDLDVLSLVSLDEATGHVYYLACDGDNPMKAQLHRVGLDGTGDLRLTDPHCTHSVDIAPGGKVFIDIAQTHDQPPSTRVVDLNGKTLATLATGDMTPLTAAGFAPPERFTYKAEDGKTDLYGLLYKPSRFEPGRKYPLLINVYAGPETDMVSETFYDPRLPVNHTPRGLAELGFLVADFDGRGTTRRGTAFKDAVYGKLGQVEIDDQAAGVKYLRQRAYVDGGHVGIYGTSYGGYAALMCLLRYPDVFSAASASSPVTDWRNYDSIYTERYMGLPQQNKAGYDAGSVLTYAKDLKGHLQLYFGTADNNVHPANSLQLIQALNRANKTYELQIGPDQGHSNVPLNQMLAFFLTHLMPGSAETGKAENIKPEAAH